MATKQTKSPTSTQPGSDGRMTGSHSTTGKVSEERAEYKTGNGESAGGNGSAPRTKVLANGAIFDLDRKRIIGNPPGGPTTGIKTKSQAVALQKLSDQARLDAVYRGWMSGTGTARPDRAIEAIVAAQSKLSLDIARGRASTEASRLVLQVGEALPDRRNDASGGLSVTANVSGNALAGLFSLLAGRRADIDGDVVADGDIRDGEMADVDGE